MTELSLGKNNNPGFLRNTGAVLAGSAAATAVVIPQQIGAAKCIEKMIKTGAGLTCDEVKIIHDAGDSLLKSTGLAEKGVEKIIGIPDSMRKEFHKALSKMSGFWRNIIEKVHPFVQIEHGINACFVRPLSSPKYKEISNKIILPPGDNLVLSQFHEIGHAMNYNLSKAGKFLQKMRLPALIAVPVIALIALAKHKKAEGEKPEGFFDKATTFIKNHAGKLTFAAFMPIVAEEALASFKGEKLAKTLLSPELMQKVKLTNKFGLLTYAGLAVASAIGIALGVKVKDAIAQPKKA